MNGNTKTGVNSVPFYYKLPSGRLLPFVSQPLRRFSQSELENFEEIAKIGFHKNGSPLK